ncbi:MAG: Dam family site-specific DNA-(adenine-N6)-methyltransferase [Legionella sp.]|nr:Dam family site-specific DNA-(adenine-N6)-methyltransferase [Legionella sp.]
MTEEPRKDCTNNFLFPKTDKRIKPFLKWAGNKYRCLTRILHHLEPAQRLIEPFTGSGSVFLNTAYSDYLLAEDNRDLIHLFQLLQNEGVAFIDYCSGFFIPANNVANRYYEFREEFNDTQDPWQKGALFLYLNRHGYNGLCRYNRRQGYNVPFGRYDKPYFPRAEMQYFHQKSQQAQFVVSDFRQTMHQIKRGDIVYCDPPYVPLSATANYVSYTHKKFSEADQLDLVKLAIQGAERGAVVLISNHDTPFTREHYHAGQIISFPVMRSISCQSKTRCEVQELVAIFRK